MTATTGVNIVCILLLFTAFGQLKLAWRLPVLSLRAAPWFWFSLAASVVSLALATVGAH